MAWRYQPVWQEYPSIGRVYSLCEVFFDEDGKLESWTDSPSMTPSGNDEIDLRGALARMLADAYKWEAVNFSSLAPGMSFNRRIPERDAKDLHAKIEKFCAGFVEVD